LLRWCRIVASQPTLWTTVSGSQALSSTSAPTSNARLPTPHLFSPRFAQQRFHPRGFVRPSRYEHAETIVGEAWVVLNGAEPPRRKRSVEQNPEYCRQRTE